jgi:leucyl/phenylalanyl-tRNA---protein transferase
LRQTAWGNRGILENKFTLIFDRKISRKGTQLELELAINVMDIKTIVNYYASGYFLMANGETPLDWYRSVERAIIPLNKGFRYPKSLNRVLNRGQFKPAINMAFEDVVTGCAARETTWISDDLKDIYFALHRSGWAHSFEMWEGDKLAGGILGIAIGGAFIGESMFYNIPDGSKVAMVELVKWLRMRNFTLFDVQINNPHLDRFGAYTIDDELYQEYLTKAIQLPCRFDG